MNINPGMSMSEVIKNLGSAQSVDEFEPSRKVIFHYPTQKIVFYEGRVVAPDRLKVRAASAKEGMPTTVTESVKSISHGPRPEEVDRLLREIMRESSADASSPTTTGASPQFNPGQPMIMPPVMEKE